MQKFGKDRKIVPQKTEAFPRAPVGSWWNVKNLAAHSQEL